MGRLTDKNRFLLVLGFVLAGGFLAVTTIGFLASRQSIRTGISEQSLPLTSDNIYSEIQKDLLRPIFISSMMAGTPSVRDWILSGEPDHAAIFAYLSKIEREYGVSTTFLVAEPSRRYYQHLGKLKTVSQSDPHDHWYFRVREMKEIYEVNLDPDEFNSNLATLFVNYRILDDNGKFLGSTGVGLTVDTIADHIDRIESKFQRRVFFIDRQGRILLAGRSMAGVKGSLRDIPGIGSIVDRIVGGNTPPMTSEYRDRNSLVLVNSRYIPELSSFLVVEQPEDTGVREVEHTYLFNLAVSLVASMIVLALVQMLVVRYQTRIETLARQTAANAARELELARTQQDFFAMISHEFGTPLAIIDAALHGLQHGERQLPPDEAARWSKIFRASHRLRELMVNYLTDDRLRQSDPVLTFSPVDVFALATRVGWRAEWPQMDITLPDTRATVSGDAELLGILFFNLISNAMKYSPKGTTIRIDGVATDDTVEISIHDHGVGIAADDLPRVFDKYYRAQANLAGGAGLGLHVVRKIAEMHGGTVTAESVLGRGSCFRVRMPLIR